MQVFTGRSRSWFVKVPMVIMFGFIFSCFGIVSLGLGVIFWVNAGDEAALADRVEQTPTSTVAEARTAAGGTVVELSGTARANPGVALLTAPLSGRQVLAYTVKVEEYDRGTTDSNGRRRGEGWDPVDRERSSTAFLVEDGTGRIAVDASEADLRDAEQAQETFGNGIDAATASRLAEAGVDLPSGATNGYGRYRVTESAILPDAEVYVLGPVDTASGEPVVGAGSEDLLVSSGSEEEFLAATRETARSSRYLAYGMFGLAGVMVIGAVVVGVLIVRKLKPHGYEPATEAPPATGAPAGSSPWRTA